MSEFEILRRQEYKRNRKKWMLIQIIAIAVVAAIALCSFFIYYRMNRTYYIEYSESSNIDYKVHYVSNEFYDDEWLKAEQAYISSLVDGIAADFEYELNMDANNVGFDYSYFIEAVLLIADRDTGNTYYSVSERLRPQMYASAIRTDNISIKESVSIDYNKFNAIATNFIDTYALENADATLIVSLNVEALSSCEEFEETSPSSYTASLNIPLNEDTFSIQRTASVPDSESKVLACTGAVSRYLFFVIALITTVLAAILAIVLIVFLHMTKNEDITYVAKVRKLLSAYRSFIQRIDGEFDDRGYQTVAIKSFNELLGIRDTIQSPILMSENKDETKTRFLIPTSTKLLYVFEIKVDNYDDIYGKE